MTEEEYEQINERVNYCIGRLTVPMMKFRDEDTKAVHAKLLELAHWLDDSINLDSIAKG